MEQPWTSELTPAMREGLRGLHVIKPWISVLKLAGLLGIWMAMGLAATASRTWWACIPCWLVMGFVFHGLGIFTHEGAHGTLFGKGPLDRFAGFLCGLPIFFSCSCYRATHLLHHRYENTARDPDNLRANIRNRTLQSMVFWTWCLAGMFMYLIFIVLVSPTRAEGRREKLVCILEVASMVFFYGLIFHFFRIHRLMPVLVYGWIGGFPFAALIANVRGLAEHTMLKQDAPPDPLKSTRTTLSSRIISFFFNNQNYHLEHHLFPRVFWYNLPRVHELLKPVYERRGASICASYTDYAMDALRFGPLESVSYDGKGNRT